VVRIQERQIIPLDNKVRHVEFPLGCSLKGLLRFSLSFKVHVVVGEIGISDGSVGIECDCTLGFFDRSFISA